MTAICRRSWQAASRQASISAAILEESVIEKILGREPQPPPQAAKVRSGDRAAGGAGRRVGTTLSAAWSSLSRRPWMRRA
jgi:hypothetical protein